MMNWKRATGVLAAAVALVASAGPAAADWPSGTFSFQLENDQIAQTDRHYTNGLRLDWVSDKAEMGPLWMRDVLSALYPFAPLRAGRIGFSLGQNMYTPEDTDRADLIVDDRPYAGWLYAGVALHAETSRPGERGWHDTLDTVELQLGVIGPPSMAEETQNTWHRIIGVSEAQGWDNQIKFEPGIVLVGQRIWRADPWRALGLEADLLPRVGGSIGNVMTFASAGVTLRLGQGLELDYGPPLIRPSLTGLAAVAPGRDFGWYFFAGVEGRGVLRDIFLDGNTFKDSHNVDKKPFVADLVGGVAVFVDGWRFGFTYVHRTREFDGQDEPDRYGAFNVAYRF